MQPDGALLAAGLEPYSEKGEEYVELLRSMIRVNRLAPLDSAILSDEIIGFESSYLKMAVTPPNKTACPTSGTACRRSASCS